MVTQVKYFCDKCGSETTHEKMHYSVSIEVRTKGSLLWQCGQKDLCHKCGQNLVTLLEMTSQEAMVT